MKSIAAIIGLSTVGLVWAEVGHVPLPELSNVTATGLLGWYAWHTATRTIPALMADFRAELAARRTESLAERDIFRKELSEERMQRHADHIAVVQALDELTASVRANAEFAVRNSEFESTKR